MTNTLGPGGGEAKLPGNALYPAAMQQFALRAQEAIEAIAPLVAVHKREAFLREAQANPKLITTRFKLQELPLEYGEVDGVDVRSIGMQDDAFLRIDVQLFSGNSPFVYDRDEELIDDEVPDRNTYTILSAPELPPFMVFTTEFESAQFPGGRRVEGHVDRYLAYLEQRGEAPHFLPTDAQQGILDALQHVEIDRNACMTEVSGVIKGFFAAP